MLWYCAKQHHREDNWCCFAQYRSTCQARTQPLGTLIALHLLCLLLCTCSATQGKPLNTHWVVRALATSRFACCAYPLLCMRSICLAYCVLATCWCRARSRSSTALAICWPRALATHKTEGSTNSFGCKAGEGCLCFLCLLRVELVGTLRKPLSKRLLCWPHPSNKLLLCCLARRFYVGAFQLFSMDKRLPIPVLKPLRVTWWYLREKV